MLPTLFTLLMTCTAMAAETRLQPSAERHLIQGQAPVSTEISAMAFYSPAFTFNKKMDASVCKFAEDRMSPAGHDRTLVIKAQRQEDGRYTVKVPTKGQRGACPYVLTSVYLDLNDAKVSQNLSLSTEKEIQQTRDALSDVTELDPVTPFEKIGTIYCEFESEFEIGLCHVADGLPEMSYQISDTATSYALDVKDESQRPPREF
ncbi:hypothetical protein Bdt_1367 [Bdellovibrio bacteriovorus str. Tiberius]|uniref:Uncharacterized protein n=2 Tax=Bdellovibrio bacteriovorus TaxID=959 RepID=K7YWH6_BDEBC|nr:hypothetical protein Bdt_1367 [Bdellovibrio bacteriovorus str. Tiberius]